MGGIGKGGIVATLGAAALVLLCVVLLFAPVPTAMLDVVLGGVFGGALLLLLTVARTRRATDLSTFSSWVLGLTLLRMSAHIASSRQVLSRGEAGGVIAAAGEFGASGSLVVGAVVFVLLSLLQVLVVTRGAERASEVAARFALDALPARLLGIDQAERAQAVSRATAARERQRVHDEARWLGSLDGAMKFVRGDALVGLALVVVNLSAGIWVGIVRDALPADEAVSRYGVLALGDGLVTIVPSLMVSLSAALLATRIDRDGQADLLPEVSAQAARFPGAWLAAGFGLIGLAALPRMPSLGLGLPGTLLVGIGLVLLLARGRRGMPRSSTPLELEVPRTLRELDAGLLAAIGESAERRVGLSRHVVRAVRRDDEDALLVVRCGSIVIGVEPLLRADRAGVAEAFDALLLRSAAEFVTLPEVAARVEAVEAESTSPVLDAATLTLALRQLVAEGEALHAVDEALRSMLAAPGGVPEGVEPLVMRLRELTASRRLAPWSRQRRLVAWALSPVLDAQLSDSVRCGDAPLAASLHAELSRVVDAALPEGPCMVVVEASSRRFWASWLRGLRPMARVVTRTEVRAAGLRFDDADAIGVIGQRDRALLRRQLGSSLDG